MFETDVYFNNFNLATLPGVKIVNYNVEELPDRTLNKSKLARADQSILTSAEYASKQITVNGFIGGDTKAEIDQNFIQLKGAIQLSEVNIRVDYGGSQVNWVGTLNSISKKHLSPVAMEFELQFLCSNPIGRDTASTTLLDQTTTNATATWLVQVEGSSKARPLFTITITSLTDSGNNNITIQNASTNQGMKINRNFNAGDIISIDSLNMEVTVNNTPVDFEGSFPMFLPGSKSIQYIDDFTARNVHVVATYNKQYS